MPQSTHLHSEDHHRCHQCQRIGADVAFPKSLVRLENTVPDLISFQGVDLLCRKVEVIGLAIMITNAYHTKVAFGCGVEALYVLLRNNV